jgi:hypothetical protein
VQAVDPARTGLVLDDELLAEPLRQLLCKNARHDVRVAAGGERYDDRHGPRWPLVLSRRNASQRAERRGHHSYSCENTVQHFVLRFPTRCIAARKPVSPKDRPVVPKDNLPDVKMRYRSICA